MRYFKWLIPWFPNGQTATSLYRRGMHKAKNHDRDGALEDYTTALGIHGTPAGLIAMVLFNRALVYVAAGEHRKGIADLDAVLSMSGARADVKTMARQKLLRMECRTSRNEALANRL